MASIERTGLAQPAVLWRANVGTDRHGEYKVNDPVQIRCRWLDTLREVLDKDGNTVAVDVQLEPDRPTEVGSVLWQGLLTELPVRTEDLQPLYTVITYNETPDIKGRAFKRKATMMRFRGSLPTVLSRVAATLDDTKDSGLEAVL